MIQTNRTHAGLRLQEEDGVIHFLLVVLVKRNQGSSAIHNANKDTQEQDQSAGRIARKDTQSKVHSVESLKFQKNALTVCQIWESLVPKSQWGEALENQ